MLAVRLAARGSSDTHAQRALLPAAVSVVGRDAIARVSVDRQTVRLDLRKLCPALRQV